jgi:sugar transferase (PEP-CTERM/EpsH1 system associated)
MKVLVILSRVPYPLEKGDKLRAYHQIRELSKKHQVILLALNDQALDPDALPELKKYCQSISIVPFSKLTIIKNLMRAFFTGMPMQVGYFTFAQAQRKVDELVRKHQPAHIYCQLIRTAEYGRRYPQIPKTLDYMDVFSKGMQRRMSTDPFYMRPLLWMEYRRLKRYERKVFALFNNKTIISEQDRELIPHEQRHTISVVPNGVDTSFFKPLGRRKEFEVLFNGNMSYPPNVESAEFLVEKIMPYVWKKIPAARVLISGANPAKRVQELASDRVVVSGWVDDIRENFAKSRMLVAPMQISIGLQNKLLEAMAMNIPCITSVLANNALGARPGEQVLVAEKPEDYAKHIIALLENEASAARLAQSGMKFAISNFNWQAATARLEALINRK